VAGLLLVVVGVLWLLDVMGTIELRIAVLIPAVLAVVGLALIIGSFDGPHTGLVIAGVFLTIATLGLAVAPIGSFRGGIGERNFVVTDEAELEERYDLGLGEMNLDLSGLELTSSTSVAASVGAGEITVTLPGDLSVQVEATAGAGEISVLGEHTEGVSIDIAFEDDDFSTADVTLTLDVTIGAGEITVRR
jgi:predicted membrane protein